MQILLDTPPEAHAVSRPVAIWPIIALTVAALIGVAVGIASGTELPERQDLVPPYSTTSQAV